MTQGGHVSDDKVRTNLQMPRGLYDELTRVAEQTGRSKADIVCQLVDEYLQGRKNGGERKWVQEPSVESR